MRHLVAASALIGLSLAAVSPAEAKSVWLKCGDQTINLDSAKERFSMQHSGKVFQGTALFSPSQINFENHWQIYSNGGGIKYSYEINRKTLAYKNVTLHAKYGDKNWEPLGSSETGKCSIMKTPPTAGNQI